MRTTLKNLRTSLTVRLRPLIPRRPSVLQATAVVGVLALALSTSPTDTTGAWFASQSTIAGNAVTAGTLQAPLTVNAARTLAGNSVAWNSALGQQWATANNVHSNVTYTLQRTINGGDPTTRYIGTDTSFFDMGDRPKVQVANPGLVGVGCGSTAVLANDGTVWSWGANNLGQLGNNSTTASSTPVQATGLTNVVSISVGCDNTLALRSDGTVWAWGAYMKWRTVSGATYRVQTKTSAVPVPLTSLPTAKAVAAGSQHNLIVAVDGTVWSWGINTSGQLGSTKVPTTRNASSTDFVQVTDLTNIVQVSAGAYQSLALDSSGRVWAWGGNTYGAVGDGTTTGRNTPQLIQGLANVNSISAGFDYSLASTNDGRAWAWGGNRHGELGIGTTTDAYSPTQIQTIANVTSISAGSVYNSMAVDSSGQLWAWGDYESEPNGKFTDQDGVAKSPQPRIGVPAGALTVAVGGSGPPSGSSDGSWHTRSVVVRADGSVWDSDQSYSQITGLTGSTASIKYCTYGGAPATEPTCPIDGNVTYSVSYTYKGWSTTTRKAVASSTALPVWRGVVLGPNNTCLDIAGNNTDAGAAVDFWTCNGVTGQTWTLWSDGTLRSNNLCLDIDGDSSTAGAKVGTWTCTGRGGQVWVPRGDGTLFNPRSASCLDDRDGSATPATQLRIWTCSGGSSGRVTTTQTWTFVSNNAIGPLVGTGGKCVDNDTNTAKDGNRITVFPCMNNDGQKWFKLPDGTLRSYNMCMSIVGSAVLKALIELRTCSPGNPNQQWAQQADFSWKNPASGLCLDDPAGNTADGTRFALWVCNGEFPQKWATIGTGNPVVGPGSAGKCLDVVGNKSVDGTAVDIYDCNGVSGQNWTSNADNTMRTLDKCMSVSGGTPTANSTGATIELRTCSPGDLGQQWVTQPNASLRNPVSGLCLDTPRGNTANGTQLQLWTCNELDTQRWTFI